MGADREHRDVAPPAGDPQARRRRETAQHVREARDRLTSTVGIRAAFDHELLRGFARNRISASLVILLLVATVGSISGIWVGTITAGIWTTAVLVIHAIIIMMCRRFLAEPHGELKIRAWRQRFIGLDLCFGLAWMSILVQPVGVN
jgi:two-component system, cell cycle sensor histidine kinase PleC